MTRFFTTLFLVFIQGFFSLAMAATLHPVIELTNLSEIKAQPKEGNEIRVHVTEMYPPFADKAKTPTAGHMLHWRFLKNQKLENAWLWQGKLDEGEVVDIRLTLVEVDPPIDVNPSSDKPIGGVTVKLENKEGSLETTWTTSPNTLLIADSDQGKKFRMDGSGAIYEVTFKAKQD
jgi:hypothetical protein